MSEWYDKEHDEWVSHKTPQINKKKEQRDEWKKTPKIPRKKNRFNLGLLNMTSDEVEDMFEDMEE